ncbi:phosphoribosyltransferase [Streptomyces sp. NPDC059008]|uniref:phosphoribosyltransferase n=1 Tax=Streptomyces sp. NPDC059008 TaxID=3346693 RepID=UPI003691F05F
MTEEPRHGVWTGEWVTGRLGIALNGGEELSELLGLALRRNPKRAHLLVSNVLGKHVPQSPDVAHGVGVRLGRRVRTILGEDDAARAVVLGYAEDGTGLGHSVADGLALAPYFHSTRRSVPSVPHAAGFEEEHCHATSHFLLPEDPTLLAGDGPLVLVDDEISTGRTVLNTIRVLHARYSRERYVIVALADLRNEEDRTRLDEFVAGLGARLELITLAAGGIHLPDDVLDRGQQLVAVHEEPPTASEGGGAIRPETERIDLGWPAGLPDGGRHGFTPAHRALLEEHLPAMAERIAVRLNGARRTLVLGNEELMYVPLRLAGALRTHVVGTGATVHFSTTTRSPVLAVDDPGYAIRTRLAFPAHDRPTDGPGERYAYNVAPGSDLNRRFDAIVAVVDSAGDRPELHAPGGLLDRLAGHTDRLLLAVVPTHTPRGALPCPLRGPAFSSYAPDEVGWLLQDLSDITLEASIEEFEEAVQGGAHDAELLPVEYQPNEEYQELVHTALRTSAGRIARAVGTVTETVLAERGPRPVLVSIARAGTPAGILMRRWAQHAHGLDLPHYAVSIVHDRGIDTTALRWLAAHHDPADVVFVDNWTGKGLIARELTRALADYPAFDPRLVVLADPGGCVDTYGTRDEFLIPTACLDSTISGLVSRTVLRADLVGPNDFHGAKFYRELVGSDLTAEFLDTVTARFDEVADEVAADARELATADRTPTWAGWAAVERIRTEYGMRDINLVKPGVNETTRTLLRRVPWRILVRREAGSDLDHVRLLAEQRGVPFEEVDELPYTCVGLIHPHFTRSASGADSKAPAR